MDKPQVLLREVDKSNFQAWRNTPCTLLMRQFLADYSKALEREAWEHLAGKRVGQVNSEFLLEIVGRAKACLEMADLGYDVIKQFYQTEEEANATEVSSD